MFVADGATAEDSTIPRPVWLLNQKIQESFYRSMCSMVKLAEF